MRPLRLLFGVSMVGVIAVALLGLWRQDHAVAQDGLLSARQLDQEERTNIDVFRQASPSVVNIVTGVARARRGSDLTLNIEAIPRGSGSGFVWDRDGHIVTNYHVVRDADAAQVLLSDGTAFNAQLVGAAPEFDIAVLKINAPSVVLAPIAVGRSNDLAVGQKVFAIGNPFGLDHTLTTGIVSGLGREIQSLAGEAIQDVIQTDAAINPGNSGGPLLDNEGNLIGMNTAILSRSGSSAGVGFAVPVNTIKSAVPDLISHGRMVRPVLGVTLAPNSIMEAIGEGGTMILKVSRDGAAAEAGLQATRLDSDGNVELGDIIMSLDGQRIASSDDVRSTLRSYEPGDVVTVGIKRGDEFARVKVALKGV